MVQINSSAAFVVAVIAANVLAAPTPDFEDGSIARREPAPGDKSKAAQQKINNAVRVQETKLKGQERNARKDKLQAQDQLANDIMSGNFNAAAKDNGRVQTDKGNIRNLRKTETQVASYARPVKREPAPGDKSKAAQQKINNAVRVQETKLKGQERNTRKDKFQAQDQLAKDIMSGNFNAAAKDNTRVQADQGSIRNLRKTEAQVASYARPVKREPAPGDKSKAAQQKINNAVRVQEGKLKTQEQNARKDRFKDQNAQINDIIKGDFKAAQADGARVQKDRNSIKDLRTKEAQVASYARPVRRDFDEHEDLEMRELDEFDSLEARSFDDFELEERDLDEFEHLEARSFDDFELEERGFDDYELEERGLDEMDLDMLD